MRDVYFCLILGDQIVKEMIVKEMNVKTIGQKLPQDANVQDYEKFEEEVKSLVTAC